MSAHRGSKFFILHSSFYILHFSVCPRLQGFRKPLRIQIVLMAITDIAQFYFVILPSHGVWTIPMALLRVVVGNKADATTVDVRILSHDSPHNLRKPVRLFKALFDLRHMINGSCTDFREHTAYTQVGAHKIALIQVKLLTLYKATDNDIDKIGSNGHHDELSDSNPSCQPSGKGAQFALFFLLTQLVGLYSFCSTSISVKVSMISPTSMSPKLTSEIPHSRPVATSLASSL